MSACLSAHPACAFFASLAWSCFFVLSVPKENLGCFTIWVAGGGTRHEGKAHAESKLGGSSSVVISALLIFSFPRLPQSHQGMTILGDIKKLIENKRRASLSTKEIFHRSSEYLDFERVPLLGAAAVAPVAPAAARAAAAVAAVVAAAAAAAAASTTAASAASTLFALSSHIISTHPLNRSYTNNRR